MSRRSARASWRSARPPAGPRWPRQKGDKQPGSSLTTPLSRREHRDRISGLEEPGLADGGRDDDVAEAPIQNILWPPSYLTGQPTNQPPTLMQGDSRRLPWSGPVTRRRLGAGGVEVLNDAGATVPRRLSGARQIARRPECA